jgi:thiol:disulfide interchange protein DsbA
MNCAKLDKLVNEHAVATLSRLERAALDGHVQTCPRCAMVWQAAEILRDSARIETPHGLFDRVIGRVADAPVLPELGIVRRNLVPLAIAAAAVLVALVFFPYQSESDSPIANSGAIQQELVVANNLAADVGAGTFVEAVHYRYMADAGGSDFNDGTIEVEEFFMYQCSHCYTFEGLFNPWCEAQPNYVSIVRVPVIFNSVARLHARAFYAAELLGLGERMHSEFFAAIHERGEPLDTDAALANLFARFGVEEEEFLAVLESPAVHERVRTAEARSRRYGIRGTPSIVVNGEYEVAPGLAGSFENMLTITRQLVDKIAQSELSRCIGTQAPNSDHCEL